MNQRRNSVGFVRRARRSSAVLAAGLVALLAAGCSGAAGGQGAHEGAEAQAPEVRLAPENGAKGISPLDPVTAEVQRGRIVEAKLTNADGGPVDGELAADRKSWKVTQKLGYGRTYTLSVTAKGAEGPEITKQSTFTTLDPAAKTYVSMIPLDGETVGVGQPLVFRFSENAPAPDKAKAEEAIRIRTEPAVEGAFYWYDDREVHWRPKDYWAAGTTIDVDIDVYGKELGDGVWGEEDRQATFHIGDRVVLKADGASHRMTIEKNGEVIRTMPVSLGKPEFPSNNGVHVVMSRHRKYLMDSSTYGLPVNAGGYRTEVEWAVRISNGGEFLHAAPWSVADQGHRNVSHGCINMSNADAEWVFNLLKRGDVVEITNSGGPDLRSWDGFGDWQVPWSEWEAGNR
ncbi:Ig-like domain-containing protein [Saccharopolyspora griseoalba]|uniref:Ig-like domain-containing protein n=1 Tax=Saccharopolyspora griseoalba TaxID=1431848 RepID=A0ABW2LJ19_9PSEU